MQFCFFFFFYENQIQHLDLPSQSFILHLFTSANKTQILYCVSIWLTHYSKDAKYNQSINSWVEEKKRKKNQYIFYSNTFLGKKKILWEFSLSFFGLHTVSLLH